MKKQLPNIIQIDGHKIMYLMADRTYKEAGKRYGERLTYSEALKRGAIKIELS